MNLKYLLQYWIFPALHRVLFEKMISRYLIALCKMKVYELLLLYPFLDLLLSVFRWLLTNPLLQVGFPTVIDESLKVVNFDYLATLFVTLNERIVLTLTLLGKEALNCFIVKKILLRHSKYFKSFLFCYKAAFDTKTFICDLLTDVISRILIQFL